MPTLPASAVGEVRLTLTLPDGDGTTDPVTGYAFLRPNLQLGTKFRASNVDPIVATPIRMTFDGSGVLRDPESPSTFPKVLASDAPGHTHPGLQWVLEFHLANVERQPNDMYFTVPAGSFVNVGLLVDPTPQPSVQTVFLSGSAAEAAAIEAAASAAAAQQSQEAAAQSAAVLVNPRWDGTSTTSLAIGTGNRTVVLQQSNVQLAVGQFVRLAALGAPGSYMAGTITAVSGTSITVAVVETAGSGTYASWGVVITGVRGVQGPQGPAGTEVELAYASAAADFDVTLNAGGGYLSLPGVNISFVMPNRPVKLRAQATCRFVIPGGYTGADGQIVLQETTGGNVVNLLELHTGYSQGNNDWKTINLQRRLPATQVGTTRSFKLAGLRNPTLTWRVAGDDEYPQMLEAVAV